MIGFLKRIYARLTGIPSESIRMEWKRTWSEDMDRAMDEHPEWFSDDSPPRKKGRGRV